MSSSAITYSAPLERFNDGPFYETLNNNLSEEVIFIAKPASLVWQFITDPALIILWDKHIAAVQAESLTLEDLPNLVGTKRVVTYQDGVVCQQSITDCQREHMFGYANETHYCVEKFTVQLHMGLFNLFGSDAGTELQWLNYLEYQDQPNSDVAIGRLIKRFRHALIYLKWCAENAVSTQQFTRIN